MLIVVDALVYRCSNTQRLEKVDWSGQLVFCFHKQTNSVVFTFLVNLLYSLHPTARAKLASDLLKSDLVLAHVWDFLTD